MKQLTITLPELPYAVEEAMNRLRINIKFCGKNTRKILLTSCLPNEGKSTISAYLWKMLAEAGFPTVLVDVDLRKSVMKKRFQIEYEEDMKGLNHYLSGMAEYEEVVYETNIQNGYIVPCTQLLENPSALLEDVRFQELLDKLAQNYRFVIIDTPPLGSVSDGALIASMCDGAVLVVCAGETPKAMIRQSLHEIEQSGCKLLGTVLNRAE
ncbi:MAG: CpsD/CapB family tyrosine-protein kinase, partial [Lachnospiraceae bacterium]|nr:CpsD/CapB family tyrosine-protein kinase [Lachnospiraceae bacterium]